MPAIEHTIVKSEDAARRRPVQIDLWVPVGHDDAHPVVVLSHGAFGAAQNYGWLAEHLARHGYLVAGVNHYGESFVYGPETVDPSAPFRPEERTRDLSFAIDHLLREPTFRDAIDPT